MVTTTSVELRGRLLHIGACLGERMIGFWRYRPQGNSFFCNQRRKPVVPWEPITVPVKVNTYHFVDTVCTCLLYVGKLQ